jgi:phage portal protein BeeE
MGGDELGQPNHEALLKTLELNQQLLNGVAKAMNASYAVNGVLKYNSYLDKEDMQARVADFEARLAKNESGILPIDLKAEYTPLERKTNIVDEDTLKFVDEKILRNFGVPLEILRGNYTQETYNAFYQKTLEGIIIALGQAFTKKLFTDREKAFGNRVEFYPKDLIFMTVDQTIRMIELLSPTGAIFENEKRTVLGLRPKQELEGLRYMSLNWIEADKAAQYQTGANVNLDIVDENREEV